MKRLTKGIHVGNLYQNRHPLSIVANCISPPVFNINIMMSCIVLQFSYRNFMYHFTRALPCLSQHELHYDVIYCTTELHYDVQCYPVVQLENFMRDHESKLPLPKCEGEDTIFEFLVGDSGEWEHWQHRVRTHTVWMGALYRAITFVQW